MDQIWTCNHCGGHDFFVGKQVAYAEITKVGTMKSASLFHEVCQHCGTVNRSYVENPEKFVKKKVCDKAV
ncbi:MAG: hypothetical protein R3Y07_06220 [Eubacteriales bacterium]